MNDTLPTLSSHVVHRWRQRVNGISPEGARLELEAFLCGAKPSTRPRRWMQRPPAEQDERYWLNPDRPDVVVVTRNGHAVSVLVRDAQFAAPSRNRDRRPQLRGRP
jgi:hypothetical protein